MKSFVLAVVCLISLQAVARQFTLEGKSLASAINQAAIGDIIIIPFGHYRFGNVVLDKSISIIGKDMPVLDGENKFELFTVTAKNVFLSGLHLINSAFSSSVDYAAIKALHADGLTVTNCIIENSFFGIHLSGTDQVKISDNKINCHRPPESNIGNAIHLWKCNQALITNNFVSGHRDGIYFEFVTQSIIENNHSEKNQRYGLHFMFSHENQYLNNQFIDNGAGVAVMYSHTVTMKNNLFAKNWGAASYGLLLKDIRDSEVEFNRFVSNTMGLYMEGSSRIKFISNEFKSNGYAARVQASCDDNVFERNNFQGNTFDVATNGSMVLNTLGKNYWDKYEGYDLNKDGWGDIAYHPVSLYSMVVERVPASILLWRSFMVFLLDRAEKNIPSITPQNLMDTQPAMKPYDLSAKSK